MLDAASIIGEAEDVVGVTDTDAGVRANLERLIVSLLSEARLPDESLPMVRRQLLGDTLSRLEG